jgi:hypothetical protein
MDDGTMMDERRERMDRVAVLYAEITAGTREFLRALAQCDHHRDWAEEGFASCADWLAWRIGVTRNTANEKVRTARALEDLPLISESMARGELSFSKVRALTRAATPDNEAELLTYARSASTASLERLVRGWKTLGRLEEAKAEQLRHRLRRFSVLPSEDGTYAVRGVVSPEVGAMLMRAIEAASDALYRACPGDEDAPEPEQLRADALGLVAERALAAGLGEGSNDVSAPISGGRSERYQVVLHVEPETLGERGEPGMSELEDGTRVSAETARRLSCDAAVVAVAKGPDGSVLDIGRRSRTVSPALRRALEVRDRGCRFPGCGLRFTAAHHMEHWADGGETSLRNTLLLCRRHHRLVHEDGYRVVMGKDGQVVFFTPRGKAIGTVAPVMEVRQPGWTAATEVAAGADRSGSPAGLTSPRDGHAAGNGSSAALIAGNRARGVAPDWRTGMPFCRCEGEVPPDVEIAALEAMDRVLGEAVDAVA